MPGARIWYQNTCRLGESSIALWKAAKRMRLVLHCLQDGDEQQSFLAEGMGILQRLESQIEKRELQRLLGGEYDEGDARLSIQVWSL